MKKKHFVGAVRPYDLHNPRVRVGYALMTAICVVIALVAIMPVLWVLLSGFKELKEFNRGVKGTDNRYYLQLLPASFSLDGYLDTWNQMKYVRYYLNSLAVVAGSVVCAVLFNGLLAYGISRLKPRGWKVVWALIMGTLMVPATTSIVPLFINITRLGLGGSFLPLWMSMGASAFYVVLFKNFYDAMPGSLLEAARLDGCDHWQLFFRIVLPLSMPINIVIVIYAVNAAWSDFLLPYLVLGGTKLETVMVRLFTYRTSDRVNNMDIIRAIVFSIIPPIVLFIAFQRQITQNVISAGIKG
ncbi:MAG: carbohydrate ABC transporter permease [Candidatus Limiplasma sp.]|nr:carbohydrate ABC transporter permease [Candidatus Limiplasma sp.]MEA5146245.1 carbohydrate ABC transporter permease [Candidatus Limiplasma sp.]